MQHRPDDRSPAGANVHRHADPAELDAAPADWTRWARWREGEGWTHHERPEAPVQAETRRPRGDQSERGHHLGRGTRWAK